MDRHLVHVGSACFHGLLNSYSRRMRGLLRRFGLLCSMLIVEERLFGPSRE